MGCLGVFFALTDSDVAKLRAFEDEQERRDYLMEEIEEDDTVLAETVDKAWDAMHRCFAEGSLDPQRGQPPLSNMVLGGESLYSDDDYIMWLKKPQLVMAIAAAAAGVSREGLVARYGAISPDSYGMDLSEVDRDYTWENFVAAAQFYKRAAAAGKYVLFTADQ